MTGAKIFTFCIAGLTALAVSAPKVVAHNTAKYTGVPFVVPIACQNDVPNISAKFVTVGGRTVMQITASGETSGAFVYCSVPGSGATTTSTAYTTSPFPLGVCSFYATGLSANVQLTVQAFYSDGSASPLVLVSNNGLVTVSATSPSTPGALMQFIAAGVETSEGTFPTVYLSNFTYNNQPLLLDTSQTLTNCNVK